jgi:hypothetical protein
MYACWLDARTLLDILGRGEFVEYVGGLVHGLAETTMDFIVRNPRKAKKFREAGFKAAWRMLN